VKVKTIAGRFLLAKCQKQQPEQPPKRTFWGCPRNEVKGQSPKVFTKKNAKCIFINIYNIYTIYSKIYRILPGS
jgi:hypothetical protein